MENASKALLIAGGILISVIMISVIVFAFQNVREYQSTLEIEELKEQQINFNKQFDQYNAKKVYGSNILSLVNKVYDYNKRENESKGYSKMDINITFVESVGNFEKNKTYTADQVRTIIANLEQNISKLENKIYCGKSIKQLSSMRTEEIQNLFTIKGQTDKLIEAQVYVNEYTQYKTQELTIKTKLFNCTNVTYDKTTGRIKLMQFLEVK